MYYFGQYAMLDIVILRVCLCHVCACALLFLQVNRIRLSANRPIGVCGKKYASNALDYDYSLCASHDNGL